MAKRSRDPISDELPRLIADDPQLSLRKVAEAAHVDPTHLSRALRGRQDKRVTGELAGRIASALDLPIDYFPEYREWAVIDAVRNDGALRDRIYRQVSKRR